MSNLPSVKQKVQVESARTRSPVSESLIQTMGDSINFLIDFYDAQQIYNTTNDANIASIFASLVGVARIYQNYYGTVGGVSFVLASTAQTVKYASVMFSNGTTVKVLNVSLTRNDTGAIVTPEFGGFASIRLYLTNSNFILRTDINLAVLSADVGVWY